MSTEYPSLPEAIVTIVLVFLVATILIVVLPSLIFPNMLQDNVEKHIVLLRTEHNYNNG